MDDWAQLEKLCTIIGHNWRCNKGCKKRELSRLSVVSKPKIYEFLNEKTPMQTSFVRLAEFLEIDPNELIVEVEEDEQKY